MFTTIDNHAKAYWYLWLFNRWLAFNLNAISAVFAVFISAVIVSTKGIDASLAGFALSFALQYSSAMVSAHEHIVIQDFVDIELDMDCSPVGIFYSINIEAANSIMG